MALIKEITLLNGETGNYWKIIYAEFSKETMLVTFVMYLFKNASFALNGNLFPLKMRKAFSLPINDEDLEEKAFKIGYEKLAAKLIEDPTFDLDLVNAIGDE